MLLARLGEAAFELGGVGCSGPGEESHQVGNSLVGVRTHRLEPPAVGLVLGEEHRVGQWGPHHPAAEEPRCQPR